ncbi:maleylpyruvate isomerase family mycothiol-dependent enzyme [Nocardioides sp. zg-579]|uniref:Maleylpyruvate isomerase family mycothiol-dependent enzyme n=2 Tax=Nocardioides marmotae TaxID=2663857 RepID=A0A6I3J0Z3_9ACTN|nr:maleylpyruvate isomerase family mycothiol-dependent enzyme [Gordonia jinghuaiqii]MTB94671.1 maleylpyruvate isomerase family mycothiol-dependent enzyme [Nocardioides marmotae]
MTTMPDPRTFPAEPAPRDPLAEATARLIRTVDAMGEDDWRAPSLLPGWSRAHVVAHLTLNAEALTGVLDAAGRDEPAAMYVSPERRDADIDQLAAAGTTELRDRFLASTTTYADAVAGHPEEGWRGTFDRTPGLLPRPLADVPAMRLREVEIHHVDLGLGATPADWPRPFATALVETLTARAPGGRPLRLVATDADLTWDTEPDAPTTPAAATTVRGSIADLAWWLTGRPPLAGTEGPTTDDGDLPRIEEL